VSGGGGRGEVKVQLNTAMDVSLVQKELGFRLTPTEMALEHAAGKLGEASQ
jgi:hypothetical protein